MSKHLNTVTRIQKIYFEPGSPPEDYHEDQGATFYKNYIGQLKSPHGKYYSSLARKKYYHPEERKKHLAVGHWVGYRFAIQRYTKENDWVLDPTCGSGTALVESYNNRRNSCGVELEFKDVAENNLRFSSQMAPQSEIHWHLHEGTFYKSSIDKKFKLVINGPPYPILRGSNLSSDVHESTWERDVRYHNESNLGMLKDSPEYWDSISKMYSKCRELMHDDGFLCTIIKDPTQDKKYYPLSQKFCNLLDSIGFRHIESFLHKHIPSTLFMHTYPKKFPDVKIPLYQTGMVYEKT